MPALNSFNDVKARVANDPAFLANLVVDPRKALREGGFQLEDPADVTKVELLVRSSQENLRASARVMGIRTGTAEWGIGAGCCNSRMLLPGELTSATVRPGQRRRGGGPL